MSVLALQLAGPLQSWGALARFARRTTEPAPTKSGVLGLLAAAQGRDRAADLSDLAALRFGVRIDQPGTRIRDFHTAHHAATGKSMPVSERFYLADAVFIAAVEGDDTLIGTLHDALRAPVYLPYLGRRSCPPSRPIDLGIHTDTDLEQALAQQPWRAAPWHQQRRRREPHIELALILEARPGDDPGDTLPDQPLSFAPHHRRYALRTLRTTTVSVPNPRARLVPTQQPPRPDHDPTTVLEGA